MNSPLEMGNNNLENGYIYQELIKRIDSLEKQNKEIMSLISQASNDMKISVKDYVSIIRELNNRVTFDEFKKHAEDTEIHLHRSKTLEEEITSTDEKEDK